LHTAKDTRPVTTSTNGFHNTFAYETNKNSNIENDFTNHIVKKIQEENQNQDVSRQQFNIPLRSSSNNRGPPLAASNSHSTNLATNGKKKLITQKSTTEKI
jgi:hypothetical protein